MGSPLTLGVVAFAFWVALYVFDQIHHCNHDFADSFSSAPKFPQISESSFLLSVDHDIHVEEENKDEEERSSKEESYKLVPVNDGVNGVYFMKDSDQTLGIFKPIDEEAYAPNNTKGKTGVFGKESPLRPGITVGEAAAKEVAAYLLDKDGMAGVPETRMVALKMHPVDTKEKMGSFQAFVESIGVSEDFAPSKYSQETVERIAQLDLRIFNCDRHSGNMLVQRHGDQLSLLPIDHGYSLPDFRKLSDAYFEWSHWKQAELPFSEPLKEYIRAIDIDAEVNLLKNAGISDASVITYILCAIVLKMAVSRGKTIKWIADFLQRDLRAADEPSKLEQTISRAAAKVPQFLSLSFDPLDWNSPAFHNFIHSFLALVVELVQ